MQRLARLWFRVTHCAALTRRSVHTLADAEGIE
ncbi:hypothetical protein HNQ07_000143 [Deinococcus metalli]|uniref:Uncharacterized protein n=1 Tax=Deinococcus metalli TaxID=1141878 RepID=A0A7W8KDU5_9DEIO|nr:hypothetical protein [Deinococcus metalli]